MSLQPIIDSHFPGSRLTRIWSLSGGISAQMTGMELQTTNGRIHKVILRCFTDGRSLEIEYRTLNLAYEAGLPVPRPYALGGYVDEKNVPYLLMEFKEGEMSFTLPDPTDQIKQMAEVLAQIHQVSAVTHDLSFLPFAGSQCPEGFNLPAALSFPDLDMPNILPRQPGRINKPVLLHGDYWPGNLLWLEGHLTVVIDWEDAQSGDPLIDLARSRSEIAWIFGLDALNIFTSHYQAIVDCDYSDLPYWDYCALIRQLRLIEGNFQFFADYFVPFGRTDITPKTIQKNLRDYLQLSLS